MTRPAASSLATSARTSAPEKVTVSEVEGLTRWAEKAILASPRPGEELGMYSEELEALRAIAEPKAQAAIDRFETIDGVIAVFQREARLGRSTASAIRKELARAGGLELARMGAPYDAIVNGSVRWGDEAGGTIHVGFDASRLKGRVDLGVLRRAMDSLPRALERGAADPRLVTLMRQRYQAFLAD